MIDAAWVRERAARLAHLLAEVDSTVQEIRAGDELDLMRAMTRLGCAVAEACEIAAEISLADLRQPHRG